MLIFAAHLIQMPPFQLFMLMDSVTSLLSRPVTDPTLVFLLVLLIILLAPMIFNKLRIPHLIGMILAGVLVGKHGLCVLERDASFELFGKVGMFYIMFLAGLEMDMVGMKQNMTRGVVFGVLTSLIPFGCGFLTGQLLLGYSVTASLLLACIFGSHTIVSYPIVSRYGLNKHPAVTISISATMIALLAALLMLAAIAGKMKGEGDVTFWIVFTIKCTCYFLFLFIGYPKIIRWFFRKYTDRVMQYIFVIAMVFFSAALAEACGIEGLLGAFISGLIFNRFIPSSSSLMNRIEFVGNALFIPYFLVGVGMLVNLKPLIGEWEAVKVVVIMVVVSTLSKLAASFIARKAMHLPHSSGLMMFGLTEAHAAGAIAMVMVGTKLEVTPGVPLMNNAVLDGVVVMILFSCIISSIATDQGARKLKTEDETEPNDISSASADDEKILVLVKEPEKIKAITQTAIMMRNRKLNRGLICLNVVNDTLDDSEKQQKKSREYLQIAHEVCDAADIPVQTQSRLAVNFVNGIVHSLRENDASEIILGLHERRKNDEQYLGRFTHGLVQSMNRQIIIVGYNRPPNTLRKIVVAVPEKAEYECGFYRWIQRISRFAVEIGCKIEFHSTENSGKRINSYVSRNFKNIRAEYKLMEDWDDFMGLKGKINEDHMLVAVTARPGSISYNRSLNRLPDALMHYFSECSVMIIYPDQYGTTNEDTTLTAPHTDSYTASRTSKWLSKWISKVG